MGAGGADAGSAPGVSAARAYRRARARRRGPFEFLAGFAVVLAAVALVGFYGQHLPPASNASAGTPGGLGAVVPPSNAPPYLVLGTTGHRTVTCGSGQSFSAETVQWQASQTPLTTDQLFLEVQELIDGDLIGGPAPTPAVTTDYVCAGSAPSANPSWYAVLEDPAGVNVAYFSYASGWVPLDPSVSSVHIVDGSTFVLLAVPDLSGSSFGLCFVGNEGGPSFDQCAQL